MTLLGHPILTVDDARAWEAQLFNGDPDKEWSAMTAAGSAIASAVIDDCDEMGGFPLAGRLLILAGKGHNGGDALLAAAEILARYPAARAEVMCVFPQNNWRPLARRAWRRFSAVGKGRIRRLSPLDLFPAGTRYTVALDGVFGFQFRPPLDARVQDLLEKVNRLPIRLRAAVDLPSAGVFKADFTYATGIVKTPALNTAVAGRVRYLDLGFFGPEAPGGNRVLTRSVIAPLAALRAPASDKRTYGHVFIVGGSRHYPGAVLMSVLAAVRSGVGLVTAFVPETLVPMFAARVPEAMWVGWPETPGGGLALEGDHLLRARIDRATALVMGPGMGREAETLALVRGIAERSPVPLVLDADALQPEVVRVGHVARILTPHAGEFARIAAGADVRELAEKIGATIVLKGPVTQVVSKNGVTHHAFSGGPALARGGSGDILAGLLGGLLAQTPDEPVLAAARGVLWHGTAADLLTRKWGQTAIQVTQLLDFLPLALRESAYEP